MAQHTLTRMGLIKYLGLRAAWTHSLCLHPYVLELISVVQALAVVKDLVFGLKTPALYMQA